MGGAGTLANTRAQSALVRPTAQKLPQLKLKWAFGLSRCDFRVGATDGARRLGVRGQPERHRLCAGCDQRVHSLVLQLPREECGLRSVWGPVPAVLPRFISAIPVRRPTHWMRPPVNCCGRPRSRSIRWPGSRDPLRFIATAVCTDVSYEESQGARPRYGCCTFRGSLSSLNATTGKVIWRTYMIPGNRSREG